MKTEIIDLGVMPYKEVHEIQNQLQEMIIAGDSKQYLLLVEHMPIFTIGKTAGSEGIETNLLKSYDFLERKGIEVIISDRGGNITYHGPGQLVGYPVLNLRSIEKDVNAYVDRIENFIMAMLDETYDLKTAKIRDKRGVWLENRKIMAIGCNVKRWVTKHGFALNVNADLEPFSWINPCGYSDMGVTSISRELSRTIEVDEIKALMPQYFRKYFQLNASMGDKSNLLRKIKEYRHHEHKHSESVS